MKETIKTIFGLLATIVCAAIVVFMLWLTLWVGYDLGLTM